MTSRSAPAPSRSAEGGPGGRPVPGLAADVATLHAPLLRFARARLRNPVLAEDAVSDTLLAALESGQSFRTESQAAAWVFGVLRHKLVDQLRRQGRETPAGDMTDMADASSGVWSQGASAWDEPEAACMQRQFVRLLERCCASLPPAQARAFLLREVQELDADEICADLGVTRGHLWVLLPRARLRLRPLLQEGWSLAA